MLGRKLYSGTRTSLARLFFVLEVPLCKLRSNIIYSVPCDRIVQRAYYLRKLENTTGSTSLEIFSKGLLICERATSSPRGIEILLKVSCYGN